MTFFEAVKAWIRETLEFKPRKVKCVSCGKTFWDHGYVRADCCSEKCQYDYIPF